MDSKNAYSLEEISRHNNQASCWMAIDNRVYDVTDYINHHHGGKAILHGCGKEASQLFRQRPNTIKLPHPDIAWEDLKKYYIGELEK